MKLKWRLITLALQVAVLVFCTNFVTGSFVVSNTWFFAGLLAVAINSQLLEPYYPRPGDVIANTCIFLLLYNVTNFEITTFGWLFAVWFFSITGILAVVSIALATSKIFTGVAKAARTVSMLANAQVIYSVVFFLSIIESYPTLDSNFWVLASGWAVLIVIGRINWQHIWSVATSSEDWAIVEGMTGPSVLYLTAPSLPKPGESIKLAIGTLESNAIILKRIVRKNDVWGQVHVTSTRACEAFYSGNTINIRFSDNPSISILGSVDKGSTDTQLKFVAAGSLKIGEVVGVVTEEESSACVAYQIFRAEIEQTDVRGGGHLITMVNANQVGIYNQANHRLEQYLWVPPPGKSVIRYTPTALSVSALNDSEEQLGLVIGTNIPVFLDCSLAAEGHLAILGMTKMGKTTLAERLALKISSSRVVTILDITGEYAGRKGYPIYSGRTDMTVAAISVFEPKADEIAADRALGFLEYLMGIAEEEYRLGIKVNRTIIIDEAHQFIPEPAGLGFNAPGRDSSFKIGLLLMQVRKFGISVILISQRTAVVAKSALSQCENLIAFRSLDQTGLDYLEAVAGGDVRGILPRLSQGQALVFGPAISSDKPVAIELPKPTS